MNYFKDEYMNDFFKDLRKEKNEYFFDLANLENKYFKLYIYSGIKACQQKRIVTKLRMLEVSKKII